MNLTDILVLQLVLFLCINFGTLFCLSFFVLELITNIISIEKWLVCSANFALREYWQTGIISWEYCR